MLLRLYVQSNYVLIYYYLFSPLNFLKEYFLRAQKVYNLHIVPITPRLSEVMALDLKCGGGVSKPTIRGILFLLKDNSNSSKNGLNTQAVFILYHVVLHFF